MNIFRNGITRLFLKTTKTHKLFIFCSYVAKAIARGEKPDTVTYLTERAKLFGLVKAERKRHREKAALNQQIWGPIPLS